jgi:hypothetical protein
MNYFRVLKECFKGGLDAGGGVGNGIAGPTGRSKGGIIRSGQIYGDCEQSIEKLKKQWTQFTSETFLAIAEEEMRLRREERQGARQR